MSDVEGVPGPGTFDSVGRWFRYLKAEGFSVPVQAPWAIQRVQEALDIEGQAAFEWLVERRLLVVEPGFVVVDLRATTEDIKSLAEEIPVSGDESR